MYKDCTYRMSLVISLVSEMFLEMVWLAVRIIDRGKTWKNNFEFQNQLGHVSHMVVLLFHGEIMAIKAAEHRWWLHIHRGLGEGDSPAGAGG